MSLGDRIGSMIKAVFCLVFFFVFAVIFNVAWSSYYLFVLNNNFILFSTQGTFLRNCAATTLATSAGTFVLILLLAVLFYYCGNNKFPHCISIFGIVGATITNIVFLIILLIYTTTSRQDELSKFYLDAFITHKNEKPIKDWMDSHKCDGVETLCNDQLDHYLNKRVEIGFIMTGVCVLLIGVPIFALLFLLSLMSCITPEDSSDEPRQVPSEFHQTIIETKRYLSDNLLQGKITNFQLFDNINPDIEG
ncbi:hypothetical protein TRFO_01601 [Tritrichomonas foetus]|uniref:Tetraspanin family protein n=1 Tax=Tritrichomonas foetus TaxID=1144522 RepID=A0A1J4JXJ1_9EUKA|nr:hypothetical protein TRFO_01601 [Tritrichomonas foetus]|eukprot:OHT03871.1 hypothetical protein TRFO_01601 [Tritrichomonas foetus]